MSGLVGALQALGATRQRDGSWLVDCAALQLGSLFGGDLDGQAVAVVAGAGVTFKSPPELAACGKVWMVDVADEDAFCQALGVAIDELREQVRGALQTLRRLGCRTRLQAPDPRARGTLGRSDRVIGVVIDAGGDLVIDEVDGDALPTDKQASMMAPDEATAAEFLQLVDGVLASLDDLEATGVAAAESLSKEELLELQAALDEDSDEAEDVDDDSDDDERTTAGVPMPVPSRPRPTAARNHEDAVLPTVPVPRPVARADFNDDEDDEPPTATLETPIARPSPAPTRAPLRPMVVTRALATPDIADDDDDDPFDGTNEPTATRPLVVHPTAVPENDGGLLDAFDDDSEVGNAEDEIGLDANDVVEVDPDDVAFAGVSTAVQTQSPPNPTASPAVTPHPAIAAAGEDFEESTASIGHQDEEEDFDDGKTRALPVDEALLALLKRGDAGAATPAAPASAAHSSPPVRTPAHHLQQVQPGAADDDGFAVDVPPTNAAILALQVKTRAEEEGASVAAPPPIEDDSSIASAFDEGFDASAAGFESDDDGLIDGDVTETPLPPQATARLRLEAEARAPAPPALAPSPDSFDEDDAELRELEVRAAALEAELASVQRRIKTLRAALEPTGTGTPAAPPTAMTAMATAMTPPLRLAASEQPRVGDSDEGEVETAASAGLTSLASLQSIDVHELQQAAPDVRVDPRAEEVQSQSPRHARTVKPAHSLIDAFDDGDEPSAAPGVAGADEDVVSLAALQGALKELGVLEGGHETQIAASVMNFSPVDDDGEDVFGSGPGGDSLAEARPAAADLSVEATRIRNSRASSIALVVEDERARDRLKKHLADRFSALIEASDGESAMSLRGIGDVDAIVFVRPRRDGGTLASFSRLEQLPQRPRVLVISADDAFDDVAAVDLRLPLGQRASEVARQVLDGLEQLGVHLMPAA